MDLRERPTSVTTRHPWETVRASFFCRLLAEPGREPQRVLDVGAGDAYVAEKLLDVLPAGSTVTCVDSGYSDEHVARPANGLRFTRECPDDLFDVIVLLDVLEHVEDDRGFLSDLVTRLRPDGRVVISVPAHQALYTQHDVALGHHRRYSSGELRQLVSDVGLSPRRSGSLFGSLIVPRAIEKALERARGIRSQPGANGLASQISTGVSLWTHGPVVTNAIRGALELDARLCELAAKLSAPSAGLSVWALCERG